MNFFLFAVSATVNDNIIIDQQRRALRVRV